MYDFSQCKLCGKPTATATYKLPQMWLYVCSNCDFHFIDALDEIPGEASGESLLTDSALRFIESKLPQNARQLQKNLQFVQAHLPLPGRRCLDIGSGAGQFLSLLKQAGAEPVGIEPQQIFREFTQQRFQLPTRRELISDRYWQNDNPEQFDLVTLWDTLEHVNFPVETLKAAGRVLKPGGFLFLDTPSRDSLFYRASEWAYRISKGSKPQLLNSLYSPKPYRHKQLFTKAQLWRLLENTGFSIVGHSPFHRSGNKLVVACRKLPLAE